MSPILTPRMKQSQLKNPLADSFPSMTTTKPTVPISNEQSFLLLPTEIHMHIASLLSYPDALALKHTNSYLYSLVRTDLPLRVDWIIERHEKGLAVPRKKCELGTDESFCNSEVNQIMEKRRWHLECKRGDAGCLVVEGSSCGGLSALQLLRGKRLMLILSRGGIYVENQVLFISILLGAIALLWRFFTLKGV